MTSQTDMIIKRAFEGPLTPEMTSKPPFKVSVTCSSCGRSAEPKPDRWRFGADWTADWVEVFARRSFRCRCGGVAGDLTVNRDEDGARQRCLKIERARPGSYAQASGR